MLIYVFIRIWYELKMRVHKHKHGYLQNPVHDLVVQRKKGNEADNK